MLSERLKFIRKETNTPQKIISEILDVTERTYRRYESGEIDPPTSKTIILANYFNVSTDYLLGLSDDPTRH